MRDFVAQAAGKSQPVTLYAVTGLDFSPAYLWLDAKRDYFEAGTDSMAGFALHRELEIDVEAGIPVFHVLRLATLGAARIMGLEQQLGSVRPGKLADLVLVDGDPASRISDVRKAW